MGKGIQRKSAICKQVLAELRSCGSDQTIKVYRNHGITSPLLGVSYASFKAMDKRIADDTDGTAGLRRRHC
jgi:hypothetical protein